MMEIVSKANSVRISPKKLRKVADLVRGLNVNKALNSLSHMDEKGAAIILKTLSSSLRYLSKIFLVCEMVEYIKFEARKPFLSIS